MWEWRPLLRCLPKHIKISKCYNFNENWYLEDFQPEECDSDKCDLKMVAIAAILAAIFNMVAKAHKKFRSAPMLQLQRKLIFRVFKMAAKMRKILKCSNFNEAWYVGFFPHEECDSDKSDLKMASYFFTGTHGTEFVFFNS